MIVIMQHAEPHYRLQRDLFRLNRAFIFIFIFFPLQRDFRWLLFAFTLNTLLFSAVDAMDDRKEKTAPWLTVPQFGDWDQKGPLPDYSLDFSKLRENRKQNKRDLSRASLGNEEELVASAAPPTTTDSFHSENHHPYHENHHHPPPTRKGILSCFNCCLKA